MVDTPDTLQNIEIFASLPVEERKALARQCQYATHRKGEAVFLHRENTKHRVYFILSGSVRLVAFSSAGREVSYDELGSGQLFGQLAALENLPRSMHMVALTKVSLASIEQDRFLLVITQHRGVCLDFYRRLGKIICDLSERVLIAGTQDARRRVRLEILRIALAHCAENNIDTSTGADSIALPTHQELACRVGTAREVVSRELRRMQDDCLIKRDHKTLTVPSFERLRKTCEL